MVVKEVLVQNSATDFLQSHSLGKGSNGCFPSAAKRRKRESIIDASEDSQLEAAIAASLQENSAVSNRNEKEIIDTPDEDSLTEFSESESEPEKVVHTTDTSERNCVQNDLKTNDKTVEGNNLKNVEETDGNCFEEEKSTERKNKESVDPNSKESEGEDEILDSDCLKAYIMLRYPNGKRKQKMFPAEAALLDLMKYVESQGYANERYELITNFPRKKLSFLDSNLSLKDAGLFPRETVFVQER